MLRSMKDLENDAPQRVKDVRGSDESVSVDLGRDAVRQFAPCDASFEVSRQREMGLYGHYGRSGYWAD